MPIDTILYILALIFMILAAFTVNTGRVSMFHLSLACLIATLVV